jgi:hypothetical protein
MLVREVCPVQYRRHYWYTVLHRGNGTTAGLVYWKEVWIVHANWTVHANLPVGRLYKTVNFLTAASQNYLVLKSFPIIRETNIIQKITKCFITLPFCLS